MATTKDTTAAKTAATPPVPLTLQQKIHQAARSRSLYHPEGPQRRRKVQVREDLRRVPASHSGYE